MDHRDVRHWPISLRNVPANVALKRSESDRNRAGSRRVRPGHRRHGAGGGPRGCPVPVHIIARLHEWLDGYNATACTDPAQLRGYVNRLRCA